MIGKLFRATIYSLLITSAIFIALEQLEAGRLTNYFAFSFLFSLILLVEIYTTWAWRESQGQIKLTRSYSNWVHWLHHLILPLATYWLTVIMLLFFQNWSGLVQIILGTTFCLFTVLFFNLSSFFAHDLLAEKSSNYIYDIIKIYLFFLASSVLGHILQNQYLLTAICVGGLALMLTFLSLSRLSAERAYSYALLVSGIVAIATALTSAIFSFGPVKLALAAVCFFYFVNATIHHYLQKELKWAVVLEYLAVILLALAVIINLS